MSFFAMVKKVPGKLRPDKPTFVGVAADKVERYGGSVGFGFLRGYYREKAAVKGIPVDVLAGGVLAGLGTFLALRSGGKSDLAPHLNALGDAGVMSFFSAWGNGLGTKACGRRLWLQEPGAPAPAPMPGLREVVGDLPPAVGDAFLTADEIAQYAAPR